MRLARARLHEACGPARLVFALALASVLDGPVVWIRPGWAPGLPNADGVARWFNPGRLLFVNCPRAEDLLWCMEESLRSGAAPLVVADLAVPPALTPVRRLHLAAAASGRQPLGLVMTPEAGGAAGIETRWQVSHAPGWAVDGRAAWMLALTRARALPPGRWRAVRGQRGLALTVQADGE